MVVGAVETGLVERRPSGNLSATISSRLPLTVWFSAFMIPESRAPRCDRCHSPL